MGRCLTKVRRSRKSTRETRRPRFLSPPPFPRFPRLRNQQRRSLSRSNQLQRPHTHRKQQSARTQRKRSSLTMRRAGHLTQGCSPERRVSEDHLFLTQRLCPLTKTTITQLFVRPNQRAGITGKSINASMLRETFVVRYLQAGGDPCTLQELLGLQHPVSVKCYQHFSDQLHEKPKMTLETRSRREAHVSSSQER